MHSSKSLPPLDGLTAVIAAHRTGSFTAAAESLDMQLEEAARSLGASRFRIALDVWVPALAPTTVACGAIGLGAVFCLLFPSFLTVADVMGTGRPGDHRP